MQTISTNIVETLFFKTWINNLILQDLKYMKSSVGLKKKKKEILTTHLEKEPLVKREKVSIKELPSK